ncbi:MAG TPA: hypothetical protein VE198_13045 [Actinoallomurus sp.]|nr:hypothetical protein [Actinoallomurus sp.]
MGRGALLGRGIVSRVNRRRRAAWAVTVPGSGSGCERLDGPGGGAAAAGELPGAVDEDVEQEEHRAW